MSELNKCQAFGVQRRPVPGDTGLEASRAETSLVRVTPGPVFTAAVWVRPYHRLNPDYERLKIQCVRAMSDLQSLQKQHTNALKRCEEVAKETDFYQ